MTWLCEAVVMAIKSDGQPSMYLFDGGFATFNTNGAVNGWHYYIQDYMGNNRMVVNKNGTVEQVTHYYPYGGVIGDISTNENVQKYKFEGKELDRTFGLDNYDIQARQYFAMAPSWDRIDPFAEKYYGINPYVYCGGDPVNEIDNNGLDWYKNDISGDYAWFTEKKDRKGYTYLGAKGKLLGKLEANIDGILKDIYKKEGGLYEDKTIVGVNDSEDPSIAVAFVDFMLGIGPEITIYTNQESSVIKDLKEEDRVKQTQKESVEEQKTITERSDQWMPWNHIYPGLCRPIMNYIGTYYATSIYDNNAKTTVANIVSDRKSAYSLFFHALSDHDRKANRNFGNTYQFYILK